MTTNFEKIKNMTVKEMAEELECFEDTYSRCDFCIHYKNFNCTSEGLDGDDCVDGIKQWLQSESEEQ